MCQEKGQEKEDCFNSMYLGNAGLYPDPQYPLSSQERLLFIGNYGNERKALATPFFNRNKAFFTNEYPNHEFFLFKENDLNVRIFLPYEDKIKFKIRKPNGMTIQQLEISLEQPDDIGLKASEAKFTVSPQGRCFMFMNNAMDGGKKTSFIYFYEFRLVPKKEEDEEGED